MIHDLDLICLMAKSEVKDIRANGVSLVSPLPDICNARIEFENGLVCNVTASRISMKQMRKIRIFQEDAYISCDLLEKEAQVIRLLDEYQDNTLEIETHKGNKYISLVNPEIKTVNAIAEELKSFTKASLQMICLKSIWMKESRLWLWCRLLRSKSKRTNDSQTRQAHLLAPMDFLCL